MRKTNPMQIQAIKKKIAPILKKYKIKRAGIFGSYARGEQKRNSDVDILVEFKGGLLKLVRLERDLENEANVKIDLLTYGGIHPLLRKKILSEEVRVI